MKRGKKLTREAVAGMTVNERLYVAGLLDAFDEAVKRKDVDMLAEILSKVYLNQVSIDAIIEAKFGKK